MMMFKLKNYILVELLALCFLFLFSCKKDPVSPKVINAAPKIISVSASPTAIGKTQTSTLSVFAEDEDDDELTYHWSTAAGVFLQGMDKKFAQWQAPAILGSYECRITVSDGTDTTSQTVSVDVVDVAILTVLNDVLDFSFNLSSLKLSIQNAGKIDLEWSIKPKASWITVNPEEGTTRSETDEIEINIDRSGFEAGDYQGLVGIETNGGSKDVLVKQTILMTPEMVYVPAGEISMGSESGNEDELPVHKVNLNAFWIDKYEVTNQQYADFLNELKDRGELLIRAVAAYKNGKELIHFLDWYLLERGIDCSINYENNVFAAVRGTENQPVCFLTWYGANAFAEYCGKRLPTEAEWEKAARGSVDQIYPWGNTDPTRWDCNYNLLIGHPSNVGSYSPLGESPYGCVDMAGNVWEWCSSLYKGYPYNPDDGRENHSVGGSRVVRGGGWDSLASALRCGLRSYCDATFYYPSYGFRCARSDGSTNNAKLIE